MWIPHNPLPRRNETNNKVYYLMTLIKLNIFGVTWQLTNDGTRMESPGSLGPHLKSYKKTNSEYLFNLEVWCNVDKSSTNNDFVIVSLSHCHIKNKSDTTMEITYVKWNIWKMLVEPLKLFDHRRPWYILWIMLNNYFII